MKTQNIIQHLRNHLNPLALAGAVLCLATSAQAVSIPHDYPFVPAGTPLGGTFQLVFVTPTGIAATSTDIAVYNAHVQSAATSAGLGRLTWKAIGSTATVNANANAPVTADVYLTRTAVVPKVATAANFYTNNHLEAINYNPNGNAHVEVPESPHQYDAAPTWAVWTGSGYSGDTKNTSRELGATGGQVAYGYANISSQRWAWWEHDNGQTAATKLLPLYGLSPALTTVDETANSTGVTADWHTTTTWSTAAVPTWVTKVIVDTHAVTITSATAESYRLTLSNSGSVSVSGKILDIASTGTDALNTTGGTLALDATSTLNIAKADTTTAFAGLTVAAGTILNVTSELTVNSVKDLSGATINTPKVTLAGGTLTKSDGLTIGSGKLISGTGTVAGGTVTVAGGGKVSPGTDTTINTITANGLTLDSSSLLTMNAASTSSNDQIVSGSGGLTISGGNVTFLNGTGTAPQTTIGIYNLIAYSGTIGGTGVSALTVANPVAGLRYSFAESGGYVTLTVAQGPLWSGADGGSWSVAANWSGVTPVATETLVYAASGTPSGSSVNDLTGASFPSIQFNSGVNAFTLTGNNVTLTGDPSSNVVLNNSTNTQTVNMPITLTGPANLNAASGAIVIDSSSTITNAGFDLTVKGAQPVTLNGTITGLGGVIRSTDAGKLNINSATALGTGTFTINGGTIDNTSAGAVAVSTAPLQAWNGNFTFTGTNDMNMGTGAVTMNANTQVTVNNAKTLTLPGTINGTGRTLTKAGNGTLTLTGVGNTLGTLIVNGTTTGGGLALTTVSGPRASLAVGSGDLDVSTGGPSFATMTVEDADVTTSARMLVAHDEGQRGRFTLKGDGTVTVGGELRNGFNGAMTRLVVEDQAQLTVNGLWNQGQAHNGNVRNEFRGDAVVLAKGDARLGWDNGVGNWGGVLGSLQYNTLQVAGNASFTVNGKLTMIDSTNTVTKGGIYSQVDQTGGTVEVKHSDGIIMARNHTAGVMQATYNLSGGELKAQKISRGSGTAGGTARINFHGGTLTYNGTATQSDFMNLGTNGSAYVYEGATIDTGSNSVTLNQTLLSPNTDSGLIAINVPTPITVTGTFTSAAVVITGGGGSGATALANIDSSGAVTGITVTNPGVGYTSNPTVIVYQRSNETNVTIDSANIQIASNAYTGGLTKQGAGTLTLTAFNTYTGDTVVQAGTLSISQAYLADGADVKLTTGAFLDLNTSAATDTIRSLYIDNVQKASGVWGAIGSGAAHESALITGSGFLNVLIGASGYASWAATNGLSNQPSDDSNNDGVANGVAYFMDKTGLATNPGINSSGQVTWPNGGNIPSSAYGTQYVVQTSSDLQTWMDVPVGNLDANTDAVGLVDGSLSYTLTGASPRFVRLKVTPN